eukprot:TRINITY_DN33084_c0_g1_i1.p1 TRINITY_DN33084_c0_g1~~TRINITY_DN33084_c0_g1_i1.p1  ORF type:complete len:491 (+),score=148.73 TRINITY_DN33084_c0_g1_i1:151-1623(+)
MSVEYQNSILWRGEDPTKRHFKPKYDGSKRTTRYFPGQKPSWGHGDDGEDAATTPQAQQRGRDRDRQRRGRVIQEDAAVGRLRRLQAASAAQEGQTEKLLRHRVMHEARVLEAKDEGKADEEMKEELEENEAFQDCDEALKRESDEKHENADEERGPIGELRYDDVEDGEELRALRRERVRELALLRRKQEEEVLKEEELEDEIVEEDVDEEESEEESESDGEERRGGAMMKPVFVAKHQRETVKEREALAKEEEAADKRKLEREKDKKNETKIMVVDQIRRDDEAERDGLNDNDGSDMELIDDDDEKNEAEEYEKWKIRELRRIKRDKLERMDREKEMELIERRRRMTDEEREADDRKLDADSAKRDDVTKFNFLQKYYHRGGFFQDKARTGEEPLYLRDYHEPLASEQYDKNLLPKAMQLRRGQFGKKGQVKHTHLTEVDTTDKTAAWAQHNKQVQKYQERMATAKGIENFDRPSLRGGGSSADSRQP